MKALERRVYLIKRNLNRRILLIIAGVMGILVSAFADSIGVGRPGFGIEQLSGLVIAALVTIVGIVKILFPGIRIVVRLLAGNDPWGVRLS
ncbi:MAG: hypothetical protein ACFFCW_03140 [Candidatus Hodarchaeota archaeon]